ncbi:hypothetical protein [Clostridium thermobutyricum]|uniref:hypothetical protein n=1 Tax=Clostridium thermobutyricum TaxID=29372 RepID=UPI003F527412
MSRCICIARDFTKSDKYAFKFEDRKFILSNKRLYIITLELYYRKLFIYDNKSRRSLVRIMSYNKYKNMKYCNRENLEIFIDD